MDKPCYIVGRETPDAIDVIKEFSDREKAMAYYLAVIKSAPSPWEIGAWEDDGDGGVSPIVSRRVRFV